MTTVNDAKTLLALEQQIGLGLTIKLTTEVAERKGLDYVYADSNGVQAGGLEMPTCANLHYATNEAGDLAFIDGKPAMEPGCLVGSVFCELFPIDKVPYTGTARGTNATMHRPFDDEAINFLANVQLHQDRGDSWGDSIKIAAGQAGYHVG